MTATETIGRLMPPITKRPSGCPDWMFEAYRMASSGKRTWSWYWMTCALDVFEKDAFTSMTRRYEPCEPGDRESDPEGWLEHVRCVTANADNLRELHRFRLALMDHREHEALAACQRAIDTFSSWKVKPWLTWWNAEMQTVANREACPHGFRVRWSGEQCSEGCR